MKYLFLITFLSLIFACGTTNKTTTTTKRIRTTKIKEPVVQQAPRDLYLLVVHAEKTDCEGANGPQKCLQIKQLGPDTQWQNHYEDIKDFTFEEGFEYTLQVKKIKREEKVADVADFYYQLVEVIKKEKPITDSMMEAYPVLTVTKVEFGTDGYTTTLQGEDKQIYTSTISLPNLMDKYVELNVGDQVRIAGEYAESNPIQISANHILIAK